MKTKPLTIDYVSKHNQHEFHLPITAFKKPANDKEYKKLEKILDQLIDEVKDDEKHPLAVALEIIGDNLEQYDDQHQPPIGYDISDAELVKYLMKTHNLVQNDLADIFSGQANVSKFLNGERVLSKTQIQALKKFFGLSADIFIR